MKSLLERENPLYGRINLTIDLKPMDYYDAARFYPDFSAEDKVRLYSVFGGIPYYTRLINRSSLYGRTLSSSYQNRGRVWKTRSRCTSTRRSRKS